MLSRLPLLLLLAITALAADLNFISHDISAPVYDTTGRLLRRLTAATAKGPLSTPQLEDGRIDFFDLDSSTEPRAVLTFDHAAYDKASETLRGDDRLKLVDTVRRETLSGEGYECEVAQGRLLLHAAVKWKSTGLQLTGDRADVRFDPKAPKQDAMIRAATVTGNVILDRAPTAEHPFERAATTEARYDAAAGKVYLKSPITIWKNGEKAEWNVKVGFVEMDVAEKR